MIDPIPQSDGRLSFPFRIIQTLVAAVAQEIAVGGGGLFDFDERKSVSSDTAAGNSNFSLTRSTSRKGSHDGDREQTRFNFFSFAE